MSAHRLHATLGELETSTLVFCVRPSIGAVCFRSPTRIAIHALCVCKFIHLHASIVRRATGIPLTTVPSDRLPACAQFTAFLTLCLTTNPARSDVRIFVDDACFRSRPRSLQISRRGAPRPQTALDDITERARLGSLVVDISPRSSDSCQPRMVCMVCLTAVCVTRPACGRGHCDRSSFATDQRARYNPCTLEREHCHLKNQRLRAEQKDYSLTGGNEIERTRRMARGRVHERPPADRHRRVEPGRAAAKPGRRWSSRRRRLASGCPTGGRDGEDDPLKVLGDAEWLLGDENLTLAKLDCQSCKTIKLH
jgi:hypothetical protein